MRVMVYLDWGLVDPGMAMHVLAMMNEEFGILALASDHFDEMDFMFMWEGKTKNGKLVMIEISPL